MQRSRACVVSRMESQTSRPADRGRFPFKPPCQRYSICPKAGCYLLNRPNVTKTALLLRTTAVLCIASGLVGGYVWTVDLLDRSDGDDLRWGFWHNPFMRFTPFSEPFLDASMWVLLACSAVVGLGGLMLLTLTRWGVPLVIWQARISLMTNGIVVILIVLIAFGVVPGWWTGKALALRLASMGVNLAMLRFLSSESVRTFFALEKDLTLTSLATAPTRMDSNPYAPPTSGVNSEPARLSANDRG